MRAWVLVSLGARCHTDLRVVFMIHLAVQPPLAITRAGDLLGFAFNIAYRRNVGLRMLKHTHVTHATHIEIGISRIRGSYDSITSATASQLRMVLNCCISVRPMANHEGSNPIVLAVMTTVHARGPGRVT